VPRGGGGHSLSTSALQKVPGVLSLAMQVVAVPRSAVVHAKRVSVAHARTS
jgi:hypothetical protein